MHPKTAAFVTTLGSTRSHSLLHHVAANWHHAIRSGNAGLAIAAILIVIVAGLVVDRRVRS